MLSQKDDDRTAPVDHSAAPAAAPTAEAVQALVEVLQASPEFQSMDTFADYLTSPYEDSPFDDYLTTPIMDSLDMGADMMTSPAIADYNDYPIGSEFSLFPEMADYAMAEAKSSEQTVSPPMTVSPNFDGLLTMSPPTPTLDASPSMPAVMTLPVPRRNMSATGTRKNITPESLVPLDAPTQMRKYASPSATSRKEVPLVFARKRGRSQALGDEDDELEETVTLPLNPTEAQLIEAKRRQNTIAARRSRKRKLEYTRQLEERAETMQDERDRWRSRAMACEALLKHHGLDVPDVPSP